MPLYEYRCDACNHQFEVIQKFSDAPIAVCPSCGGGPVVKLLSSPAFQFKGSGWYVTDYGRKDQANKDQGQSSDKSDRAERTDKAEKAEKAEKADKSEKSEKHSKSSESSPPSKDSAPSSSPTSSSSSSTPNKTS